MKEDISTRNLGLLPSILYLKKISQSVAMLDAILEPEWEFRYFSFNSKWDVNQEMASMRDGEGNSYFILFKPQGAIIKGYAPKSPMGIYATQHGHPYPGVLEDVPDNFRDFLTEPAFSIEETSFCIWCRPDSIWTIGEIDFPDNNDPDGSTSLLYMLDGKPNTYRQWGEKYYDKDIRIDLVEALYRHQPLTDSLIARLNPTLRITDLANDIAEISYPVDPSVVS